VSTIYSQNKQERRLKNIKDKRINVKISEKMMKDFEEALAKNEETKSEIIRQCIRKYIKQNS